MACCTGQTKCNDTVTIGYLKSFVNGIVSVTTSKDDSYCPTYAELTGGTIVPKFVDGGTNKWASNVDGILINGTYSNTQLVKVEDLTLIYTRFKSITASASTTSISECGGNASLGNEFKLTKTVRAVDNCTTGAYTEASEEGKDTASTVTYSSSQSWLTINGNTATASKNGSVSASTKSTNVTASVSYKGTTHTSTAIVVQQAALTGSYETTGVSTPTKIELTYSPSSKSFDCNGGNYTVEAVGKYYTRYKWKDSCGTVYNNTYNDVQGSQTLQTNTGSFAAVQCPTTSYTASSAVTYTWSGITSSVTFIQSCSQSCGECEDYIVWGSGNGTATAPCDGGNIQVSASVSGVKHLKGYVDGVCQETGQTNTSQTQSITVVVPKCDIQSGKTYTGSDTTSQGGTINYTINQEGGACVECKGAVTTKHWNSQTLTAGACDTSKSTTLSGTSTTTYNNCSAVTSSITSAVTVNFSANNTSNPVTSAYTFGDATVTVNQAAGPCNCLNPTYAYKYDDITVGCSSAASTTRSATYTKYTYYSNCPTKTETGNNNVTIPALSCNSGSERTIQTGTSATTLANASPKITQSGGCDCTTCSCEDLRVASVETLPSSSGASVTIATYSADCVTNIGVTENVNWLSSVVASNGQIKATVSANTGDSLRATDITISGKAGTQTCTREVSVRQNGVNCTCENVVFIEKEMAIGSGGTPSSGSVIATASFGNCTGRLGSASVEPGATSWLTARTSGYDVIVNAAANTDLSNPRSGDVTVYYSANSSDASYNCSTSFTVSQLTVPCDCTALSYFLTPIKTEFGSGGTHGDMVLIASGDTLGCGTLSAQTTSLWFGDEYGNSGASIITQYIDEPLNEKAEFYLNVLPYTSEWEIRNERSAQAQIYFIPKNSTVPLCSGHTFSVVQYERDKVFASCDEIKMSADTLAVDCEGGMIDSYSVPRLTITPKYDDVVLRKDISQPLYSAYYNISAYTDTNVGWVNIITGGVSVTGASVSLRASTFYSPTPTTRSAVIYYSIYKYIYDSGVTSYEYCELDNEGTIVSSVTLTQEACTDADCSGCSSSYIEYTYLENDLRSIDSSGATFDLFNYIDSYHSFCEPNYSDLVIDVNIHSDYSSWVHYNSTTHELTIDEYTGTTGDRGFFLNINLYSIEADEYCQYDTRQVSGSQKRVIECTCSEWVPSYDSTVDSNSRTITVYLKRNGYNVTISDLDSCHEGAGITIFTSDSAITATTTGRTYASFRISENDSTSPRNIYATASIGYYDSERQEWVAICDKSISVLQDGKLECACSSQYVTIRDLTSTIYYGHATEVGYINFDYSGDCIGGYAIEIPQEYEGLVTTSTTEYHGDNNHYVTIYAGNGMAAVGCETVYLNVTVYDDNNEPCTSGYVTCYLNTGCYPSLGDEGTLSGGLTVSYGNNVLIGTLTGSQIGDKDHQSPCYTLIGQDQGGYLSNIRFVATTQTGTSSPVNYDIIADCDRVGGPFNVDISYNKNECAGGGQPPIGTISVTITP